MEIFRILSIFLFALHGSKGLTYYDYYVPSGENITSGLVAEGDDFTLNGKVIKIFSGSFHYFRVHPSYWRDTLRKLRAAGLNAVQTYMPWNLHNPEEGKFDFGTGDEALSPFLDVRTFVQMAQEEDLFVLLRPGPYICSEWDFGGLPSWLLTDYTMNVRTMYQGYIDKVQIFFQKVGEQLADLTFQKGGAIIAVQVENEYGHFGYEDEPRDKKYLKFVHETLISSGFEDVLYYTSDSPTGTYDWGSLNPDVLMTANFQSGVAANLNTLKEIQPNRPLMVAEFWTGWFDYWFMSEHSTRDPDRINGYLNEILSLNSSVNFYMFIGGTNFGFTGGANSQGTWPYQKFLTTSYDYDSPLTEVGDYSPKYQLFKDTLKNFNPLNGIVDDPTPPEERTKAAYGTFQLSEFISVQDIVSQAEITGSFTDTYPSMEEFSFLNNGSGQTFGYVYYTTKVTLPAGTSTLLIRGHVRDMIQVFINGEVVTQPYSNRDDLSGFGFWNGRDKTLDFDIPEGGETEISILLENLGRVNYGEPHDFVQKKGIWEGALYVNLEKVARWDVTPLEFKKNFVNSLTGWQEYTGSLGSPTAYRSIVTIEDEPQDTFLDMSSWNKGVVFVNGFNLGRYWTVGPTHTLYIPVPLLIQGDNEFIVFEQYSSGNELIFIDYPIL
ncbi:UNVERIFIED_CONTAM: hypothetical protein RMT77_005812 [Armadillidium vulgare]